MELVEATAHGMLFMDEWIDHVEASPRDPLSREASRPYQSIWKRWLLHLQAHMDADGQPVAAVTWAEARPEHVQRFLHAANTNGKAGSHSDVTMRRYWRVLDRIYEFALQQGRVQLNPARAVVNGNRPKPEDHLGTIMLPRLWDAARRQIPDGYGTRATEIRDRALLLLLFDHALMPQELRDMQLQDMLASKDDGVVDSVQVDGPGPRQRRKIVLSEQAGEALNRWLAMRNLVLGGSTSEAVFCTTSGAPMSQDAMHKQVAKNVEAGVEACGEEYRPARVGPQILRNTCLVQWLNAGIPPATVAVRAGLKNSKGLFRLRKVVNPEILPVLIASVVEEAAGGDS